MTELMDIDIPDELQAVTWAGADKEELIVKARLQGDDGVVMILACDWGLGLLRRNRAIAGDGTFAIVPSIFAQAFVLTTDRCGVLWSCIICLMTRSEQERLHRRVLVVPQQ